MHVFASLFGSPDFFHKRVKGHEIVDESLFEKEIVSCPSTDLPFLSCVFNLPNHLSIYFYVVFL